MKPKKEYKKIKSFFIIVFTITSVCITVITIFAFKDLMSLKAEYNSRLEKIESHIFELISISERSIERTENRSIAEIEKIQKSVNVIAKQEAIDRIDETFKYRNIEQLVKDAAENAINKEIDKIIQEKLKKTEIEINETIEVSLSLTTYLNGMTSGDPRSLHALLKIIEDNPYSSKGNLAKKIVEIKATDYNNYLKGKYGNDIDKYLNYLKIDQESRKSRIKLISTLKNIILSSEEELSTSLSIVAAATIALQELGYKNLKMFDIEAVKKLKPTPQ